MASIVGTTGKDFIHAPGTGPGPGDFTDIPATNSGDIINTGGGSDFVRAGAGNDTIKGAGGDDILSGGAGQDHFFGGEGFDTVLYDTSAEGVLAIIGGTGGFGDAQGDVIELDVESLVGSRFGDVLIGAGGDDTLKGAGGDDILAGGGGADMLVGEAGNDTLNGGASGDWLDGGDGNDTIQYSGPVGVMVNLFTKQTANGEAAGDVIGGVENVWGTDAGDRLTGSAVGNVLRGFGGADDLVGLDGDDRLEGGDQNDDLTGGAGGDTLIGGSGIDEARYGGTAGVIVDLIRGTGLQGEAQGDVLISIENVTAAAGDDILTGSAEANQLSGMAGKDILIGAGGGDTLNGGSGDDQLLGGDGNDTLVGGTGSDRLVGGAGADRFVYAAVGDSGVGLQADRIVDFSQAQGDRIGLTAIDADATIAGNQAFHFVGTALFTGHAGELRVAQSGGVTTVSGDVNGDGAADFAINLTGTIALAAPDFAL